jgi:hypothetical protein
MGLGKHHNCQLPLEQQVCAAVGRAAAKGLAGGQWRATMLAPADAGIDMTDAVSEPAFGHEVCRQPQHMRMQAHSSVCSQCRIVKSNQTRNNEIYRTSVRQHRMWLLPL